MDNFGVSGTVVRATEYYSDSTGTVLPVDYPTSFKKIPINKSGISTYKCERCGRKMQVDWGKMKAIFILECLSCGSQDLELI